MTTQEPVEPGAITDAVAALRRGLIVGMPTDTVYGIAVDPYSESAVEALFTVKGRQEGKAISVLTADLEAAETVGVFAAAAAAVAAHHWPGPLTLVVPRLRGLPDWIGDPVRDTVGIRVPDHPTALALLRAAGPLAVTSANRSGEPPARDHGEAEAALGGAVAVYLPGPAGGGSSSTVVDLSGPEPRVLRAGPLPWPPGGGSPSPPLP